MKFGIECEKFLFDLKLEGPSSGVFQFIDALKDYEDYRFSKSIKNVTNEFVLNLVEIVTEPSHSAIEVIKDYLLNHSVLNSVAQREAVCLVPLASMPMLYQPHMIPKWAYFVQNSILEGKVQKSWTMDAASPLTPAGNCAGVHIHTEIQTPPEFLFTNQELRNKFNIGLMLSPMIAFGSSPYFFNTHEAFSMRGLKYFQGVYQKFPLNGGLPPVMESSEAVLRYFQDGIALWHKHGVSSGLALEDVKSLTANKGACWSPVKWNRQWNTIELRCMDSDRIDLDVAKFIWVCGAMRRMDLEEESLRSVTIKSKKKLDEKMIDDAFLVNSGEVTVLPTQALHEVFDLAILYGTKHPLVERYLHRICNFSREGLHEHEKWIFNLLKHCLETHATTSEIMLSKVNSTKKITNKEAIKLVGLSIEQEKKMKNAFIEKFPGIASQVGGLI
jgi:hypothetical protein